MKILSLIFFIFSAQAYANIGIDQRAMIIISDLDTHGRDQLAPIYRIIEKNAVSQAKKHLANQYRYFVILDGKNATLENYKNILFTLSHKKEILAIDTIVGLHGNPDKLYFFEKSYATNVISTEILNNETHAQSEIALLKSKLRMFYNLSCYGKSMNDDFFELGYKISIGSIAVNANAEIEYAYVLKKFALGETIEESFAHPNSDRMINLADKPVRLLGGFLKDTNSKKEFLGDKKLTINDLP